MKANPISSYSPVELSLPQEWLHAVMAAMQDSAIATNSEGEILFLNRAAESLTGWRQAKAAGKPIEEIFSRFNPSAENPVRKILSRRARDHGVRTVHLICKEGMEQSFECMATLVRDADSAVSGVLLVFKEITARRTNRIETNRAEDSAFFFAEAGKMLSESLEYERTLTNVAHLAVPRMADWCELDMLTPAGEIELVEVAHSVPEEAERARQLRRQFPLRPGAEIGVQKVIGTGIPELYREIPDSLLEKSAQTPEHLRLLRQFGLKSALIVPISARGRIFGAITFMAAESGRRYSERDLSLAEELGLMAGLAVDNALLYQKAQMEIAERKQIEAALVESKERFRLIVERARDYAIFTLDKDGQISSWNPGAERLFGYTEREAIGRNVSLIFTPEDCAADIPGEEIRIALEGGRAIDDRWHVRKNKSRFWSNGIIVALQNESGELRGFAKIMRDMTDAKRNAEAIHKLNQELENRVKTRTLALQQMNEQLEAFTYTAAHDLRAPLRAMFGFAQALQEDYGGQLDDSGRDFVERIKNSAQRMDDLITDLLEYSRISRSQFQFGPVSLQKTFDHVMTILAGEIENRSALISVQPSLPSILGHQPTLEHIFANLIANAIKFVPKSIRPKIRVWSEERDQNIRVWIEDNGIGIAPEHQDLIFRIFERVVNSDEFPGTGIGLAIVRMGAEQMGGTVGVESIVGQGSRFWVELPAIDDHNPAKHSPH